MTKKTVKSAFYAITALVLLAAVPHAEAGYEKASLRHEVVEPGKIDLRYDVYAGGFKAMNAQLEMDLDPQAYDLALTAETEGFIGTMFPWKANYSTSGHTDRQGQPVPLQHMAKSTWKKKVKFTEFDYDPDGKLLKATTQENKTTTVDRDIDEKLHADAVDILTGALMMMQTAKNTEKCEGSFPVFDGKRRYDIELYDEGVDMIKKTEFSSFNGDAMLCTIKVKPVAGFKEKDKKRGWMAVQAHTEERNRPARIWFAKVEENGPAVPVRMEIASEYGGVVAHLTSSSKK